MPFYCDFSACHGKCSWGIRVVSLSSLWLAGCGPVLVFLWFCFNRWDVQLERRVGSGITTSWVLLGSLQVYRSGFCPAELGPLDLVEYWWWATPLIQTWLFSLPKCEFGNAWPFDPQMLKFLLAHEFLGEMSSFETSGSRGLKKGIRLELSPNCKYVQGICGLCRSKIILC